MNSRLIAIGFWEDPGSKHAFPHPKNIVDPEWERQNRNKIVSYLKSGIIYGQGFGYSHCRFNDGPPPAQMGSADLTDGKYVWPEGLYVYIQSFNVYLPDWFISDIKQKNFKIDTNVILPRATPSVYDYSLWLAWARSAKR
jgi:hypothetical protein